MQNEKDYCQPNPIEARPGQPLEDHCGHVSERCRIFAEQFGTPAIGALAGLVHDWGKALPAWQAYLRSGRQRGDVTHAPESVKMLFKSMPCQAYHGLAILLGYAVYGHHSSLPDWTAGLDKTIGEATEKTEGATTFLTENAGSRFTPEALAANVLPELRTMRSPEEVPFWIRMLFSALVDADRLDAEHFDSPERGKERGNYDSWTCLETRFQMAMKQLLSNAPDTPVNRLRSAIRDRCEAMATCPRGFFTLNVPTGGGKTLSSLAFALKHRAYHNMNRIIYAIPFTSIIEQTAGIYKEILGDANVLEHHQDFILPSSSQDENLRLKYELAQENYDMPVIVTTTVQLFESLLQGRASSSRKLHNIANSVIILDEAQKLPPEHLNAVLTSLRVLVSRFNCTIVLCSATIPTVATEWIGRDRYKIQGLPKATPIISDPETLQRKMKRTDILLLGTQTLGDIAEKMAQEPQAMCIVNTRRRCLELFQLLDSPNKYHLSASMCPAERHVVLSKIRAELKANKNIAIVATSLIEAGVDIDVRTVFREIAGVDSIAQAAGRCNREGNYDSGKVYVFATPEAIPPGMQSIAANAAMDVIGKELNPELNQELYQKYFHSYYIKCGPLLDKDGYQEAFASPGQYQFRDFGSKFHFINDGGMRPLVVLYGGAARVIEELRTQGPSKMIFRKLSPYTVNIRQDMLAMLVAQGVVEDVYGVAVQVNAGIYAPGVGVQIELLSTYQF